MRDVLSQIPLPTLSRTGYRELDGQRVTGVTLVTHTPFLQVDDPTTDVADRPALFPHSPFLQWSVDGDLCL